MLAACRFIACLSLLAFTSGCAMCGSCDDDTYAAYGGRWERLDRCHGRVGSVFTPEAGTKTIFGDSEVVQPGDKAHEPRAADGEKVEPPQPMPVDDAPAPPQPMPDEEKKPAAETSVLRSPSWRTR